jgi:uncharacterized membrane protein
MYFPLAVLIAFLPGLSGLRSWDLNPPGPWWGLRALEVLNGHFWDQAQAQHIGSPAEVAIYRSVALQPPLFAWLEAAALKLSFDRAPVATVVPSYLAGAVVILLVFQLGRLWAGPGLGLVAALLTGFNRFLLMQMQQATPTTLGLAGALGALWCFARSAQVNNQRQWPWWILGGLALGISLLAVGAFGLLVIPILFAYITLGFAPLPPPRQISLATRLSDHAKRLAAPGVILLVALLLAAPWHLFMFHRHGAEFLQALVAPPQSIVSLNPNILVRFLELAPACVPIAILGILRLARRYLGSEGADRFTRGGMFTLLWLVVAAVAPAMLPGGPRPALALFLVIPLNAFAAATITDLATRRLSIRIMVFLVPATALSVAWWGSAQLRNGISDLVHLRNLTPSSMLGLHLALDLIIILALISGSLERWTRGHDPRRRFVLGGFLAAVLLVVLAIGVREIGFRHRETKDLLALRSAILRRNRVRPIQLLAVVGPETAPAHFGLLPGGRVRFMLRSALPHLKQYDLASLDQLRDLPETQRLVLLLGPQKRLSYADQSRLNLEAIDTGRSGVESAFATVLETDRRVRR